MYAQISVHINRFSNGHHLCVLHLELRVRPYTSSHSPKTALPSRRQSTAAGCHLSSNQPTDCKAFFPGCISTPTLGLKYLQERLKVTVVYLLFVTEEEIHWAWWRGNELRWCPGGSTMLHTSPRSATQMLAKSRRSLVFTHVISSCSYSLFLEVGGWGWKFQHPNPSISFQMLALGERWIPTSFFGGSRERY